MIPNELFSKFPYLGVLQSLGLCALVDKYILTHTFFEGSKKRNKNSPGKSSVSKGVVGLEAS